MKQLSVITLSLLLCAPFAQAKPSPYTGPDYSGTYQCTGKDAHEGDYTGTVTLELIRAQSTGVYGAYSFKLDVPGYGSYPGQAAARGKDMAIHFAFTDQSTKDYGTGIASFSRTKAGKWSFSKYYYEPEFKGGNFGLERCTQQ
jgi:hypothetical protein